MKAQALHLRLPDDLREAVIEWAAIEDRTILDMTRRLLKEAVTARRQVDLHFVSHTGLPTEEFREQGHAPLAEPIEERTVEPDPDHLAHENRPTAFDHQPMGLKTKGKKR